MIKLLRLLAIGTAFLPLAGMYRTQAEPTTIVSPSDYEDREGEGVTGDDEATVPFRYQAVFPSENLAALGNTPHWLVDITFRPDESLTSPLTVFYPDTEFRLTTMQAGPPNLSSRFDDNLGSNFKHFYRGPATFVADIAGPGPDPREFYNSDYSAGVTPYLFDPSQGNLLMDVIGLQGASPPHHGDRVPGILTAVGGSPNASHGEIMPAFVHQLTFIPALQMATWNVDAGGNWSLPANWAGGVPNRTGAQAIFGSVITSPRTVTVDAPIAVGRLDFENTNTYTIAGSQILTLDAATGDAQINVASGSHTITAPVTLADNTTVTVTSAASNLSLTGVLNASGRNLTKVGDGTLTVNNIRATGLSVNGGTVAIAPSGTTAGTSVLNSLSIAGDTAPTAKLDLDNNAAIINYSGASPVATVRQQILAGRGGSGLGKTWNGQGITSSAAAAAEPESRSVGYAENASLPLGPYTNFRGQPVDDTSILMAFTRTGDANLDGIVNDDDVTIVGATYAPGVPQPHWALGDFDYNGFVDDDDVTLLGVFYDPSAPSLFASAATNAGDVAAVPEPATILLAGTAGLLLLLIRRRVHRRHLTVTCGAPILSGSDSPLRAQDAMPPARNRADSSVDGSPNQCRSSTMARAIFLAIFAIVLTVPPVLADIFRWDNGELIPGTEGITPGPGVDLSSWNSPQRNLRFATFYTRDLAGANFSSSWLDQSRFYFAILTNADLSGTNLTGANLDGANLTNANLAGAIVTGATFQGTPSLTSQQLYSTASYQLKNLRGIRFIEKDLSGWDFSGQDLSGATLQQSTLTNANLAGATIIGASFFQSSGFTKEQLYSTASYQQKNLRDIQFIGENLTGWNFSVQDLTGAVFDSSTLTNADLSGTSLTYADLRGATLTNADLSGTNLTNAQLRVTTLTNANLAGAIVTGAAFYGTRGFTSQQLYSTASYRQKNLRGIGLGGNDLTGWDFSGQDLTGASLISSRLTNADLSGTNLTDAQLGSVYGEDPDVTLTNANLAGAIVTGAAFYGTPSFTREHLYSTASYQQRNLRGIKLAFNNLSGWDFSGQDLTGADFGGSRLTSANLSGAVVTGARFVNTTSGGFTKDQLYSTASYQQRNLRGIDLHHNNLTGWDFSGQDLAGANFSHTQLTNANLSGAVVTGASFKNTGITKEQLYSAASYQQRNLRGIDLEANDLTGWDFSGQDLTGASFISSRLTNAHFSFADLRGAQMPSGPIQLARNTILPDGKVNSLNLAAGEKLVAFADVPFPVVLVGGFSIAPNATFDLTDNTAIVDSAGTVTASAVREHIISGRGGSGPGGDWTGTGITSSTAAAVNQLQPDSRSLGYADNATLPLGAYTRFHGAAVDETSMLMAYTRTGDANLDGVVNDDDVTIVGATYAPGVPQAQWALGDFDFNGFVDDDDVTLLGVFYDPSAPPLGVAASGSALASAVAPVPEPSSLALLVAMTAALLFWRRFGRVIYR